MSDTHSPPLGQSLPEPALSRGQGAASVLRLQAAIRAFTVDMEKDGRPIPNGPAEAAQARLYDALLALPAPHGARLAELALAVTDAEYARLRELREAAEAVFGGDFKRPAP